MEVRSQAVSVLRSRSVSWHRLEAGTLERTKDYLLEIFSSRFSAQKLFTSKSIPQACKGAGAKRMHFQHCLSFPLESIRKCLTPSLSCPFLQSCSFVPLSFLLALTIYTSFSEPRTHLSRIFGTWLQCH